MVYNMAHSIKMDKQGRLVIPAKIRKKMTLTENTSLEVEIIGNQLIIRKIAQESEENISRWKKNLLSQNYPINESEVSDVSESEKWISEEYAWKKLGI